MNWKKEDGADDDLAADCGLLFIRMKLQTAWICLWQM